ncbi:MAG: PD-(D/E)XK nuclease domain-containing protein, partial [Bdellovibrionaceae bacterium]|nr:PD-(D/E)XK nuclease domain-containing protein [Pseudobdellovibrionaceae bacterium]
AMLWQTGYLTIREQASTPRGPVYSLSVPNHEVRVALNEALLTQWIPHRQAYWEQVLELYKYFSQGQLTELRAHFERLYASIPHDWYRHNPIAQYEGYYASVFYSHLAALGLDLVAEDVSQEGQCDLVIRQGDRVWVIEFKVNDQEASGESLKQLQQKNYAAKYKKPGVQVIELRIEFSRAKRQIVGWFVGN